METKKVLFVCFGNSDRSPVMAGVLNMLLQNTHHKVVCESAGVGKQAAKGGPAGSFAIVAAKRIGIDLSGHERRRTTGLNLESYDLIVCANDEIAGLVIDAGGDIDKVYNVRVTDPWPCKFQADYDETMQQILAAMYKVVSRYFSD